MMIKTPFLIPMALLALGACSNPEKTARYLIDPPVAGVQVPNRIGTAVLKDVSLPQYASDQEVAFQTADGAVRSSPDNLWADNPSRAFTTTLARTISEISGATVIGEPWPLAERPAREIEIRVERALAQADGIYRLSGRYFVADDASGQANHARSFDIRVPLRAEGAAGTAAALSQALTQLAQQIATLSGPGTTIATRAPAADPFGLPPLF
ncbi:MAG: PqiC family protein [Paracoccus sp. (in: a-proteobacteria)]|nr:PqiC family protein [Paracoccus sp. (in: a-proteobacteria)]